MFYVIIKPMDNFTAPIGRNVRTYAILETTETIHFFGELAEQYSSAFQRYKDNSAILHVNPALNFLAEKDFKGFAENNFQKVDFIE